MTSRLAQAAQETAQRQAELNAARDRLRELALHEIQRGVSAVRVAREIGMTRASVSKWAVDAGVTVNREKVQPELLDSPTTDKPEGTDDG